MPMRSYGRFDLPLFERKEIQPCFNQQANDPPGVEDEILPVGSSVADDRVQRAQLIRLGQQVHVLAEIFFNR